MVASRGTAIRTHSLCDKSSCNRRVLQQILPETRIVMCSISSPMET
jgi:hypothetical protein